MPLIRPTIQEIISRVRGDVRSELGIKAILRRTFVGVFSKALAGQSHTLHGNLDFISRQLFNDTQELDFLIRDGAIYGIEQKSAQKAELTIKITGTPTSIIPDLTKWQNDTGLQYEQQGEVTIPTPVSGVAESSQITTVADVSGSLTGTYFFYNTPTNDYVVWFRNNTSSTGSDPNITGTTPIQVTFEEDDTANDIAALVATEMGGAADINASVLLNVVTATNVDAGAVEDASDFTSGFSFTTLVQGVTQVEAEIEVNVLSDESGETGNVANGEFLTIVSGISGVDSDSEVVATVIEGEDIETPDSLRARIITRKQRPPGAGDVNDYEQQALTVEGITRAWVFPLIDGVDTGTVGVTAVEDGEPNIIPDTAKVAELDAALNARDFKPVTARVVTFAPIPLDMDLVVRIKPNNQTVRDAATESLQDLIFRDAAPKDAFKSPTEVETGEILLSRINESISVTVGEEDHEIVTINGLSPANVVPTTTGEIVRLGTIIWQPLV